MGRPPLLCSMPQCQTTAGCICTARYPMGAPVPVGLRALRGHLDEYIKELRRIADELEKDGKP